MTIQNIKLSDLLNVKFKSKSGIDKLIYQIDEDKGKFYIKDFNNNPPTFEKMERLERFIKDKVTLFYDEELENLRQEITLEKESIKSVPKIQTDVLDIISEQVMNASKSSSKIYDELVKNDVKYLIHFTPKENLPSILKYGICSRNILKKERIKATICDKKRYDGDMDYSSFSISFPNYQMKYSKEQQGMEFVVLCIDVEVLKDSSDNMYLCYKGNAADKKRIPLIKDFAQLFGDCYFNEERIHREQLHIPKNYSTNPQTEILIKNVVPPEYIKEIHIKSNNKKRISTFRGIPVKYDSELTKPRTDWEFWQKQSPKKEGVITWQPDLPF